MHTKQDLIDFELKIIEHYRNNKLPYMFHLSGGNEEQLIEIFKDIKPDDYVLSNHRGHYHALLHGLPPEDVENHILKGLSMFIYDRKRNYFTTSIIGGAPGIAVGIAKALQIKGSKQHVWCFVGDGNEDSGHLFEAARYVEGFDLPCTFIIEANNLSVDATNVDRWNKTSNIEWPFKCVKKYYYKRIYPHIRINERMDFSKANRVTDWDCFPNIQSENSTNLETSSNFSYKEAVFDAMTKLGQRGSYFIGYSLKYGDAIGTLKNVPNNQKIEMPVAENLIMGMGMGLALEGLKSIVYFERHDFMLVAMDAIVNHADKIYRLSQGQFSVPLIIRAVCADGGPFYSGITHSQDFAEGFKKFLKMPVLDPQNGYEMEAAYHKAIQSKGPIMIIERKKFLG